MVSKNTLKRDGKLGKLVGSDEFTFKGFSLSENDAATK